VLWDGRDIMQDILFETTTGLRSQKKKNPIMDFVVVEED
jgi:hypothetical protein